MERTACAVQSPLINKVKQWAGTAGIAAK